MLNRIIFFWKKQRENILIFFLLFLVFLASLFLNNNYSYESKGDDDFKNEVLKKQTERYEENLKIKKKIVLDLKLNNCEEVLIDSTLCSLKNSSCDDFKKIPEKIICSKWKNFHFKKPEFLRTLYYSSYGASNGKKINKLINFVKNTEINSVVIDVKEVDGKVSFDMSHYDFKNIRPESNGILNNPKKLIEILHKNDVYVIGRIVVFKDKYLAEKRPDLALKNKINGRLWTDRSGKKYLDPNSKEVWDYTIDLAKAMYQVGFDEINFDYIRYPSDGDLKNIKFPFSSEEIEGDKKWGRAKVIDNFFNYLTENLRKEFPEIQLSGDLFGYIAIADDDLKIGQLIESGILYFDRIAPMTYPSHYNKHFLGLKSADSNPYIVIKETMKRISKKIDKLNLEIERAKKEKRKIVLKENFEASINKNNLKKIYKDKIMIWLQGFSCTWCGKHIIYGKNEIQAQSMAAREKGYNNWFVWNSASRYGDWFLKK